MRAVIRNGIEHMSRLRLPAVGTSNRGAALCAGPLDHGQRLSENVRKHLLPWALLSADGRDGFAVETAPMRSVPFALRSWAGAWQAVV
jgi:hypothetical protein